MLYFDYQLRNLIEQGRQLQISGVKLAFLYEIDPNGVPYDDATIEVYGIGTGDRLPVLLNKGSVATTLVGATNDAGTIPLESAQVIPTKTDWLITDGFIRVWNVDHVTNIHNVLLLGRLTKKAQEHNIS